MVGKQEVIRAPIARQSHQLAINPVAVEKVTDCAAVLRRDVGDWQVLHGFLVAGSQRCCLLAEEADQSLDVLGHGCQEELLSRELQSAQA